MGSLNTSTIGRLTRLLRRAKRRLLSAEAASLGFASVGNDVTVGDGCRLAPAANISLGDDVFIGEDCWFTAPHACITIGSHVMLAPQVALITGDHRIDVVGCPMSKCAEKNSQTDQPITVEDDVWIGFRAVILKGVTIGTGAVVGACSVVTNDVPPYAIVAGNPARVIRYRFEPADISRHEEALHGAVDSPSTPDA